MFKSVTYCRYCQYGHYPCILTMMCRHPASGYVQGINDLVTPFLMVFLQVQKYSFIQQFWLKPPFSLSPRTLWKKMLQEWASSSLTLRLVWGKTLRLIRFGAWPRYDIYMCQSTSYGGIIIYEMKWQVLYPTALPRYWMVYKTITLLHNQEFKQRSGVAFSILSGYNALHCSIRQLEELQKRVDLTLHTHIVNRDVQYLQFSFR